MQFFSLRMQYLHSFYRWQISKSIQLDYLPLEISIEATNVCNFKCAFCPQSDPKHHEFVSRMYLEPALANTIMDKLREGGIKTETLHWSLDGEPFMNKQFHELCEVALQHEFRHMYFATNGVLLTEDALELLPRHSGARYTFTIDFASDKEYFEQVRGTQNSWDRIRSNIQNILSNQRWAHIFVELSDISTYKFVDADDLENRFEKLRTLIPDPHNRLKVFHKTFHNATGLVEKPVSYTSGKRYHLCPYPWMSLHVASNGDLVACGRDLRRKTVLGNIVRQTLPDIWNGKPYQLLRQNLLDKHPERSAVCDGCDLPYDDAKFSWRNMMRAAKGRFQVFGK